MNLLNFVFIIKVGLPEETIPECWNKYFKKSIPLQKQHEHWHKKKIKINFFRIHEN